jgi:hypothetical protein
MQLSSRGIRIVTWWWLSLTIFLSTRVTVTRSTSMSTSIAIPTTTTTTELTQTMIMVQNNLDFLDDLRVKYSHQPTFLQSVEEIALSLLPLFEDPVNGAFYKKAFVAMTEPERTISFRVPWMDDAGNLQFNRGWRVEFSRCVSVCSFAPSFVLKK